MINVYNTQSPKTLKNEHVFIILNWKSLRDCAKGVKMGIELGLKLL